MSAPGAPGAADGAGAGPSAAYGAGPSASADEPGAEGRDGARAAGEASAGAASGVTPDPRLHPLKILRIARLAGNALLDHGASLAELAKIEWQDERARLQELMFAMMIAIVCLMFGLLFATVFILALVWDTRLRLPVLGLVVLGFGVASALTWRRVRAIAERGEDRFATLSEEVAATLALLRKHL